MKSTRYSQSNFLAVTAPPDSHQHVAFDQMSRDISIKE